MPSTSSIKKGDMVRKIMDSQMVGIVLNIRWDEQLEVHMARVKFGNGVQTLPMDEIEPFGTESADMWEDLKSLRFGRSQAFRTLMTFERLRRPPTPISNTFGTARASFYPYQFKPLLKFLENPEQRVLIADDVGLGKTIEAGYILREWQARHPIRNVLIIVPARLRTKWKHELKNRFGENYEIVGAQDIRKELKAVMRGKDLSDFQWISSYETMRIPDLIDLFKEVRPSLDLLIMDEAHRARNRKTSQYRIARAVSDCADAIAFLTATPIQTGLDNLYSLVNLLEPDKYGSFREFEELVEANRPIVRACHLVSRGFLKEAASELDRLKEYRLTRSLTEDPYFKDLVDRLYNGDPSDRRKLVRLQRDLNDFSLTGHLISRTRKTEVMENWPVRLAQNPTIKLSDDERAIYNAVRIITRLLHPTASSWGQSMAGLMAFRYTASCIPAAADYLQARLKEGNDFLNMRIPQKEVEVEVLEEEGSIDWDSQYEVLIHKDRIMEQVKEILSRRPAPGADIKFKAFYGALQEIWSDDEANGRHHRKVVVFSFFKRTLWYLEQQLKHKGVPNFIIHGDVSFEERDERIEKFLESSKYNVLLSSEVGGEGIDLQKASVVVNYDLPWNPMVVEQRIGRIDRIGQHAKRLVIINLVSDETIEERILLRLYQRIGLFKESIGELDDILGPVEVRDLMIDALRGELTEEQVEEQLERTAQAAERKKDEAARLSKEVDGLLAADQAFLDEIDHLVKHRRLPSAEDLQEMLMQLLESKHSGIRFEEKSSGKPALLYLGTALSALQNWSSRFGTEGVGLCMRAQQGPVPVTFNADVAMEHPRAEFIQSRHPLIQFAIHVIENDQIRNSGAFRLNVESSSLLPGLWVLGIWGIALHGSRSENRLEAVACRVEDGELLIGDDVEELLVACLSNSCDLDPVPPLESDVLQSCESKLKSHFDQKYAEIVKDAKETDERRFARLRATWEQTLTARRDAMKKRLDDLIARGANEFAIRMTQANLDKREEALRSKLKEFEENIAFKQSYRDVAVGLVLVQNSVSNT